MIKSAPHVLALFLFGLTADAAPLDTFRDCDICPEMIELPSGEFLMGAPESETEATRFYLFVEGGDVSQETRDALYQYQEGPIHPVQIDVPIAMGRHEVTYDQWMACVTAGGCNGYVPDPTVLTIRNDITLGALLHKSS